MAETKKQAKGTGKAEVTDAPVEEKKYDPQSRANTYVEDRKNKEIRYTSNRGNEVVKKMNFKD